MYENVCSRPNCRLRRVQFGGVNGDPHAVRLTFVNSSRHDLNLLVEVVTLPPNPPQLDQIRFAIQLPPDQIARLSRRVGLDDVRITRQSGGRQVRGDQRSGNREARRLLRMRGNVAHFEVPHRAATIDNAGDAGNEIPFKRIRQPLLDPFHLLFIRTPFAQIHYIGARINPARLRKVHVRIDQTGDHPFSSRVHDLRVSRNSNLIARADVSNPAAVNDDGAVSNGRTAGAVDQRRPLNDNDSARLSLLRRHKCRTGEQ